MKVVWGFKIRQENGGDYMTRWGIMSDWLTVYIHRYVGGDGARNMHNHPWRAWFSFVVWGWIKEMRQDSELHRRAGSLCGCSGDMLHRISDARPGTITLFFGWRRVRNWSFFD